MKDTQMESNDYIDLSLFASALRGDERGVNNRQTGRQWICTQVLLENMKMEEKKEITQQMEGVKLLRVIDKTLLRPRALCTVQKNVHVAAVVAHAAEQTVFLVDQLPGMIELDDATVVEDQDLVVVDDCLQTMGDCDDCAVAQFAEGFLDLGVCGVVDGGGCFVHH